MRAIARSRYLVSRRCAPIQRRDLARGAPRDRQRHPRGRHRAQRRAARGAPGRPGRRRHPDARSGREASPAAVAVVHLHPHRCDGFDRHHRLAARHVGPGLGGVVQGGGHPHPRRPPHGRVRGLCHREGSPPAAPDPAARRRARADRRAVQPAAGGGRAARSRQSHQLRARARSRPRHHLEQRAATAAGTERFGHVAARARPAACRLRAWQRRGPRRDRPVRSRHRGQGRTVARSRVGHRPRRPSRPADRQRDVRSPRPSRRAAGRPQRQRRLHPRVHRARSARAVVVRRACGHRHRQRPALRGRAPAGRRTRRDGRPQDRVSRPCRTTSARRSRR